MSRSNAIARAKALALLARIQADPRLANRIENAAIEYATAIKAGDASAALPRWADALLSAKAELGAN
jgi:hypothetical protein